jgi:hypothetical protein
MRQRESDLALLRSILSPGNEPELSAYELAAFGGMLSDLLSAKISRLSDRQRQWTNDVAARLKPLDAKKVLRGREVPTPTVLQNLPKSPPKRAT